MPPATHRAEPTGPSTQRGGGCFCNLATLSIFSIHTTSYSLAASRACLSLPQFAILLARLILASLFFPHSFRHSLYCFLSVRLAARAIPLAWWYKQRDCASVAFSCRWFNVRMSDQHPRQGNSGHRALMIVFLSITNRGSEIFDKIWDSDYVTDIYEANYEIAFDEHFDEVFCLCVFREETCN